MRDGVPVGVSDGVRDGFDVRVSVGVATNFADVYRFLCFMQVFADRSADELHPPLGKELSGV